MRITTCLLSTFILAMSCQPLRAAEEVKPVPGASGPVVVPLETTLHLQMIHKRPIESVRVEKEGIVRITAPSANTVALSGIGIGITKMYLTAEGGKRVEVFEVIVQQDLELLKSLLRRVVPTAPVTPIPAPGDAIILIGTVFRAEDVPIILAIARGGK